MDNLVFRYASTEDAPALLALIELAYRGDNSDGWESESSLLKGPRSSIEEIETLIADRDSRFVLAELGDALAACALIQKTRHVDGDRSADNIGPAYFGMFGVHPSKRRAGIGDLVLAECERRARALWNAHAMQMTVISLRETLIGWYGRRGYAPTSGRLAFPFSESTRETRRDFDLVILRKTLR